MWSKNVHNNTAMLAFDENKVYNTVVNMRGGIRMNISKEEIQHIADLSMLNLSDAEIEEYTKSMQEIVDFATQINEVDTENVDVSAFASDNFNVFRKDEIKESLDRELLLANAPSSNGEAYSLPSMKE